MPVPPAGASKRRECAFQRSGGRAISFRAGSLGLPGYAKGADMIGSILALLVMGLIVGVVAESLVPGRDPGGLAVTAVIGVADALVGGFLASEVLGRSG